MWVVGSCLALSGLEVLFGIYVTVFVISCLMTNLTSALLCSRVGQERAKVKAALDTYEQ